MADGDFHFITTSKHLVERFLATASGEGSLGTSKDFRHARSIMPISRNDTIWFYASEAFFRNITGPHYRVEMARRLQATADIELVQLAKLAAASEAQPGGTIEELKAASLLPPEFGPLPDGSRVVLEGGEVYDSVRGRRGAFLPVSDMPVDKITRAELAEYQQVRRLLSSQLGPDGSDHCRRETHRAEGQPRAGGGRRADESVCSAALQAAAAVARSGRRSAIGAHCRRHGRRGPGADRPADLRRPARRRPAAAASMATLLPMGKLRDFLVGYVGTTGQLGLLNVLNIGIPPQSDAAGFARSPLGGWRRQFDHFTVFSFQREVLEEVVPQLRFEPAQRPAQVRLRVDDVSHARITPALNDLLYGRTRETSLGNLRLLHALDEQLHVPPAACKEAAEFLLDAKLICPLGGHYVLREENGEPPHWTSTAMATWSRAAFASGPCSPGLSVAALELVPRPRPGCHDDREEHLGPRRGDHADAGQQVKPEGGHWSRFPPAYCNEIALPKG